MDQEACTTYEQTALPRQIEATDRQIDALVYELYGLDRRGDNWPYVIDFLGNLNKHH